MSHYPSAIQTLEGSPRRRSSAMRSPQFPFLRPNRHDSQQLTVPEVDSFRRRTNISVGNESMLYSFISPASMKRLQQLTIDQQGSAESIPDGLDLSRKDMSLILSSWRSIKKQHMAAVGADIFMSIFEECPETADMFYFGRQMPQSKKELKHNKEFRFHALRFMQIIETVVENIQTDSHINIKAILHNLGHVHQKKRERGFRPYYWTVFHRHMLEGLVTKLGNHEHSATEIRPTWDKVISYIVSELKVGYVEGIGQSQDRTPSPRPRVQTLEPAAYQNSLSRC